MRGVLAGLAVAAFFAAGIARAQPSPANSALAQSSFEEGRALMRDGKYDLACDRFALSQKLDPGGGTLLNLAICYEKQGRIATAYAAFNDAVALAVRDGRGDREKRARERVAALGPLLPRLRVSLHATPPLGLELRLDGSPLALEAVAPDAPAIPVDPGAHRIDASAPDHEARVVSVTATAGATVDAVVPELARSPGNAAVVVPAPPHPVATTSPPPPPAHEGSPGGIGKTVGWVAGGIGVASIAVGAGFGIEALVKGKQSNDVCPSSACGNPAAVTKSEQAVTAAWVADAAIGAGVVALGVGLYLLLTSPTSPRVQAVGHAIEVRF